MSAEPNKAAVEAEAVVVLNGPGSLLARSLFSSHWPFMWPHKGRLPSFSLQLARGNW